ncbi:MAG: hypothetical protein SWX82_35020 [Cyanobacteriota bacterium]|nr:hypothetical protein [Cyanobacteriota bacterium]
MIKPNTLIKDSNSSNIIEGNNIQAWFVLGTAGTSLISMLLLFFILANTWKLARTNQIALVQLENGQSILAKQINAEERAPALIHNYVKEVLSLLFTWNRTLVDEKEDPGVKLSNDDRVTTGAWSASFAINEKFRTSFLKALAEMTPDEVFTGKGQSVLTFKHISEPIPVGKAKWKVDVVANLLIITSTNTEGIDLPFNKSIIVEAIEASVDPLPEKTTPVQKAVYRLTQQGLQIIDIRDLLINN